MKSRQPSSVTGWPGLRIHGPPAIHKIIKSTRTLRAATCISVSLPIQRVHGCEGLQRVMAMRLRLQLHGEEWFRTAIASAQGNLPPFGHWASKRQEDFKSFRLPIPCSGVLLANHS